MSSPSVWYLGRNSKAVPIRLGTIQEFLSRYYTNGEDILNRIVTGDELGSTCQCGDKTTVYGMGSYRFSITIEERLSYFVSEKADDNPHLRCARNFAFRIYDTWNNNKF
ncbi:uncharacterized protein TNCV_2786691 [Trichonephila clavipes]|nr:uncharacterized protein TNCV_2786691 [Trichonephila clavipes]